MLFAAQSCIYVSSCDLSWNVNVNKKTTGVAVTGNSPSLNKRNLKPCRSYFMSAISCIKTPPCSTVESRGHRRLPFPLYVRSRLPRINRFRIPTAPSGFHARRFSWSLLSHALALYARQIFRNKNSLRVRIRTQGEIESTI